MAKKRLKRLQAPRSVEDAVAMVGTDAFLLVSEGFHVRVVIRAYRPAFGNVRWLVSPTSGHPDQEESAIVSGNRLFTA